MSASSHPLHTIKVIVLGDSSTGKTAILHKYLHDEFSDNVQTTIGIDFFYKVFTMPDGSRARLQVWDTAGQERFRQLMPSYIREAAVALLVLQRWMQAIQRERGDKTIIILVGNKCDRYELRAVSLEDAEAFCSEYGPMPYVETSAKSGEHVMDLFDLLMSLPIEPPTSPSGKGRNDSIILKSAEAEADGACAC